MYRLKSVKPYRQYIVLFAAGNTEGKIVEVTIPVTTQGVRTLDGISLKDSIIRRPCFLPILRWKWIHPANGNVPEVRFSPRFNQVKV